MKIGLALSGGGARGLAHLKVLEAFDELNIKPDIIAGSSIGAFIGALYSSGLSAKEIIKFFKGINFIMFAQLFDITFKGKGLVKGTKLQHVFTELTEHQNFEDLEIPLKVVATNFFKRKCDIFSKGNLPMAVRASISIPGVFNPVKINKETYIDGGLTNLIPYDIIEKDCDITIASDVSIEHPTEKDLKFTNLIASAFNLVQVKYSDVKLEKTPPTHHIKMDFADIGLLDFNKCNEILDQSEKYKRKTKQILRKIANQNT